MKSLNLIKIIMLFFIFQILGIIQCNSDLSKDLPGNYTYVDEGGSFKFIIGGTRHIHSEIIAFEYNKDYILVVQKPTNFCSCSVDTTYADSLLFWIIDVKSDSIYGGLKTNDYFRLRKQLSIPNNLKVNIDL